MMPRNGSERLSPASSIPGRCRRRSARARASASSRSGAATSLALEVPLQAAEDVGTGSMSQRAMDAATELMIGLFRAGVNKL